ncbi:hypothetical protein SAMN05216446_0878 [Parafannyhessea umbonata]|uniref:Uncharacterized protein n=1 Tax=Parafannyhessea umbonata TaxID=604330 RepID=A0A1H9P7Z4_9ACTN|nr:hypothetical protein SAMN05216446_0878 [Parafannyhessea umbonata]
MVRSLVSKDAASLETLKHSPSSKRLTITACLSLSTVIPTAFRNSNNVWSSHNDSNVHELPHLCDK